MAEILMVRHGQAAFGTDDYDRLTEVGWEQSRLLGDYFARRPKQRTRLGNAHRYTRPSSYT